MAERVSTAPGSTRAASPSLRLLHPLFPSAASGVLARRYFVARADAVSALRVLRSLHAELSPVLLVSEIRSVAKDDWWLSPHFGRDSIGLHFT